MFMFLKKMKKNRKGYTLTELIVVVAILGVLAAVGTPMIMNTLQDSKDKADSASASAVETAVQLCLADGSLKMTSSVIEFGTKVSGSTATDIKSAIKEKLVGHEYPKCNTTGNKEWYLNKTTGKIYTADAAVAGTYEKLT